MDHPRDVMQFLAQRQAQGERAALITITAVTGASMRNPGTHMGVAESGAYAGSLTGGCIEAAVVAEACAAIAAGAPRLLHYGAGSPVIDIRLPCGGAVHLLVSPLKAPDLPLTALAAFAARKQACFDLERPDRRKLKVSHAPPLRLALFGDGPATARLALLARTMGAELALWTLDPAAEAELGDGSVVLKTAQDAIDFVGDRWTAIALMFHDHEREAPLLRRLLAEPSLSIGAMGSRATHAARIESLRIAGVAEQAIARVRSPIGLVHSSRDPGTLALSAFVEMVDAYNQSMPTRMAPAD
jgi:xanthine dehydrogenase accessory factor